MGFKTDLSDSARDFINIVWPVIKQWFEECEIRHVESVTSEGFVKELDVYAGIDAWVLNSSKGMRGLASRIQWGHAWNTFTIRYLRETNTKTEYEKRLFAIENDWVYPYYTVQAYLSRRGGTLLSVAQCKTKDLFLFIKNGREKKRRFSKEGDYYIKKVEENGAALFIVVKWIDLVRNKIAFNFWTPKKEDYPIRLGNSLEYSESGNANLTKLKDFF